MWGLLVVVVIMTVMLQNGKIKVQNCLCPSSQDRVKRLCAHPIKG